MGRRGVGPGETNHPTRAPQKPPKGIRRERSGRAPWGLARQGGRTGPRESGPGGQVTGAEHRGRGTSRKWPKGTIGRCSSPEKRGGCIKRLQRNKGQGS